MNRSRRVAVSPLPRLLEGEEFVTIRPVDAMVAPKKASDVRALMKLSGAKKRGEIGDFGPVLASLSLDGRGGDPDFHKYEAVYGRDSLRAAIDLIAYYPALSRATLLRLAETQGVVTNAEREEEPGRIAHEIRNPATDLIAQELTKRRGWGWPYYGSVDATPEFVRTLCAYCCNTEEGLAFLRQAYTGRDGALHSMADALDAAVLWMERRMDTNPEGLLEFKRANPHGLENQAWKDSWDAYFHKDGRIANHDYGIASVEVQRAAYDALCDAAGMYMRLDQAGRARQLQQRANRLRAAIMDLFWTDSEGGYFVLGTDRDERGRVRQLQIKTSNMGHLLHSRLLAGNDPHIVHMREAVIAHLLSPKMLGLNGIRTLASDEFRYRPGAYHNGSVWIWDNYLITRGLSELGYHTLAHTVNDRLLADVDATRRFPEYLRGDDAPACRLNTRVIDVMDNVYGKLNRLEQPPQDIQAWSVAAILALRTHRSLGQHRTTDPHKAAFEQRVLKNLGESRRRPHTRLRLRRRTTAR